MILKDPLYIVVDATGSFLGLYSREDDANRVADANAAYVTSANVVHEELPMDWDRRDLGETSLHRVEQAPKATT